MAALDSPNLEPLDYMDRAKGYTSRLQGAATADAAANYHQLGIPVHLLSDVPSADPHISTEPLLSSDYKLVNAITTPITCLRVLEDIK